MSTSTLSLELDLDTTNALDLLARKHRRSRRMEAIVAIETYVDSFDAMAPSAPPAELPSTEMEVE